MDAFRLKLLLFGERIMVALTVFTTVLMMFIYMACGFAAVKTKIASPEHLKTVSALLLYITTPCMVINSFQNMDYSMENFKKTMIFLGISLVIQILFFAILYLLFRKKFDDGRYRILTIAAPLGNVGYFGIYLVSAIFPDYPEATCYSMAYVISMNILVYTVGKYLITTDKKYVSFKNAFLNPCVLGGIIAILLYLLKIDLPGVLGSAVSVLGAMTTPLCMIILGMRLAAMSFKKIFAQPFAYAVSAVKLIIFPFFAYLCVAFLPFVDDVFKSCMFALSAAPSAAIILSIAEYHGCEQELSANVLLMTSILCIITLPIMCMIVI